MTSWLFDEQISLSFPLTSSSIILIISVSLCICMCCMCMFTYGGQRLQLDIFFYCALLRFWRQESLTKPEAPQVTRRPFSCNGQQCCCHGCYCHCAWLFYRFWDLNSGPHAYTVSILCRLRLLDNFPSVLETKVACFKIIKLLWLLLILKKIPIYQNFQILWNCFYLLFIRCMVTEHLKIDWPNNRIKLI